MMHYGFCRKHADQTGEGGCPECAMDHQQSTILAMTETAKEASRVHIDMHNQIVAMEAEVARLREALDGLREAYRIMRNAAAGYSQHCEGFTTKLDKDCARAEDIARAALEVKP